MVAMSNLVQTEIVARRENTPQDFPRITQVHTSAVPKFCDATHWDGLAARYLSRYSLPAWGVPCDPEAMGQWLYRLDLPLSLWLATGAYRSLQDFIDLNPDWPLRAFVGLALEMKDEGGQQRATTMLWLRED